MTDPVGEDGALATQLERAQALGFLGPGPVSAHIDHAAGFLHVLAEVRGRVIDLGSGGGVPGLVIGMRRPDLELVLLDAGARRCAFLEDAVGFLGLEASVVEGRAEVLGRDVWRGTADAVVARSFGPPAATAECAAPLLRIGGIVVVSEPPVRDAGRWPAEGLAVLGLEPRDRPPDAPNVQVLDQRTACPDRFPRRDGQPAGRPLF